MSNVPQGTQTLSLSFSLSLFPSLSLSLSPTHPHPHTHTSNTWNKHKIRFIKEKLPSKVHMIPELSLFHREGVIAGHNGGSVLRERPALVLLLFVGKWEW